MALRRRGYTVMELVVYCVIATLAAMAIAAMFKITSRTQQATTSSYLISGDADVAIRKIRRDLEETSLVSVTAYPNPDVTTESPGVSFYSPRAFERDAGNKLEISKYGTPSWQKYVFYSLKADPDSKVGHLMRWEKHAPAVDSTPTAILPSVFSERTNSSALLRNVLLPNSTVEGLSDLPDDKLTLDEYGGFRVQYVTKKGQLTSYSPAAVTMGASPDLTIADNSRLLEVELKVMPSKQTANPDVYMVKFRVSPRYD